MGETRSDDDAMRSVDIGSVPKASMQDVGDDTIAALRRLVVGLLDLLERWGRTRFWRATATVGILITTLVAAFPSLDAIDDGEWDVIHRVGRHPFTDLGLTPSSHAAKNLYRVTVPILGEALGLSSVGYMVLQALFGVLLIYGLLVVLERSTGDRVSAFLFTLTACMAQQRRGRVRRDRRLLRRRGPRPAGPTNSPSSPRRY